ncbi:MAG: DUF4136 domain-containing protein [Bacteroidota bacterium]|jgi:hypothetical protein|nr:DUF4136 domain-containing protein [Bacteroidota bacterium]
MKKILSLLSGLASIAIIYSGCAKEPLNNLNSDESRIYITDHDSTVSFSNYKTYSISDSVAIIDNGNSTMRLNEVDSAYINAVKKYMSQEGYTLVTKEQNPDLGVNVSHIISTTTGVISYGDYWNYYDGYWNPYYWGYPGYGYYIPYGYGVYQIKEGAIAVDILDLKNVSANNKINVIWTGLIRGSGIFDTSIADSQVKALFDQSTYLKTN